MIVVPSGAPASENSISLPPLIIYLTPVRLSLFFVTISVSVTAAIVERASPLKPRVIMPSRSSEVRSLLVA